MTRRRLPLCFAVATGALLLGAPARALSVGEKLPKFTCPAVEGAPLSSADLSGKVVALCFTASWVKRAGEELAYLQGLARDPKNRSLVVLPVVEREDKTRVAAFAAANKLSLRMLLDNGGVARLFGVNGLPDLFVIDSTGTVRTRLVGYGPASPESIRKALVPLLAEVKPAVAPPKATASSPPSPTPPAVAASEAGLPPALRAYAHLQLGAAHINIGDAFINAGQRDGGHYSEAVRELKAGLAAEPKNVDLLVWLGVAHERKGEQAEAVRQYQAALALDAANSYAREGLRRLRGLPPTPPPPPPATQVE